MKAMKSKSQLRKEYIELKKMFWNAKFEDQKVLWVDFNEKRLVAITHKGGHDECGEEVLPSGDDWWDSNIIG